MMRKIFLYGHLKKKFGPEFSFDVATAAEALRALNCAFPGKFVAALRKGSCRIIRGQRDSGLSLDLDLVSKFNLGDGELHVIPVAAGSKNSGGVKAILGVALVGAAIFFSGGTLAAPLAGMSGAILPGLGITCGNIAVLGLGVAFAGASQLLAKSGTDAKPAEQVTSYSLGGPVNTYDQGQPIPLIYGGPLIVGSQPVSAGFDIEQLGAFQQ
jgi:predicted phage tail protein